MDALKIQLVADEMSEIEDGFAQIRVQGARLTDAMLAEIDTGAKMGTDSRNGHGNSRLPSTCRLGT